MSSKSRSPLPILLVLAACSGGSPTTGAVPLTGPAATPVEVMTLLTQLSDDSLHGRLTGAPGARIAAEMIAREMQRLGLEPAGDSGYFQRVALYRVTDTAGRVRIRLAPSWAAIDTVPGAQRFWAVNVVGRLAGADASLGDEHILVDAHYDHIGVAGDSRGQCRPAGADSICNGADDDASGVVATLKIAQAMRAGARPRRTVLFAAMTGEEVGLLGARWYVDHPVLPLTSMTANLEIEMIGRPDSLAGGPGKAWLTGYERSTMGDMLAAAGIPLVADPRPTQQFFTRSDNYALAQRGVVAHTMSSFNLHRDYHQVTDEASRADAVHMAAVIDAAARAVRMLADGPAPHWKLNGRPEPARPRP
jgi:hypothetical protein